MLRTICRWTALLALLPGIVACGTVASYSAGCPGPLSGVFTDAELLSFLDASSRDTFDWLTVAPDLPFSAVGDLLTLPLAMALEKSPSAPISRGCYWATEAGKPNDVR